MGRTLRGFETEFPYLGARGDTGDGSVPDPGLIDKEEAYGQAAAMTMVNHRYGGEGPAQGRASRSAHSNGNPRGVAEQAARWMNGARVTFEGPVASSWDLTGSSVQISTTTPAARLTEIEDALVTLANQARVFLYKATKPSGQDRVTWIFSTAARSAPLGAKIAGYSVRMLARPV